MLFWKLFTIDTKKKQIIFKKLFITYDTLCKLNDTTQIFLTWYPKIDKNHIFSIRVYEFVSERSLLNVMKLIMLNKIRNFMEIKHLTRN